MTELVIVIAKSLAKHADDVGVTENITDSETLLEFSVAPADMGKVIGKQGRIATAIRSVIKAAASKDDKKVTLDIR